MAGHQDTTRNSTLATTFPDAEIKRRAREHGVVKRERKLDFVVFFWTLLLGFRAGSRRTLESLRRVYERKAGHTIAASSFHERFTPQLAAMLRQMATEVMASMTRQRRGQLRELMRGFLDVLCIDATVIALRNALAPRFPACHDDGAAAIKLHTVMSAIEGSAHRIKLSGQRKSDCGVWKRLDDWVKGCLLLFDLGYYDFNLFHRIEKRGGFFLSRLKANANQVIVRENRRHRGRARTLEGCTLQEAIEGLKRSVIDVQAAFEVVMQGSGRIEVKHWRVVGVLNEETGQYHLYVTNVPGDVLAAEDVGRLYAVRWQIELYFKLCKQHGRLDELTSGKWEVVEAMLWACVLQVVASQRLRLKLIERVADERHMPMLRFQEVLGTYANDLLDELTDHRRAPDQRLTHNSRKPIEELILHEAVDRNVTRKRSVDACFESAAA